MLGRVAGATGLGWQPARDSAWWAWARRRLHNDGLGAPFNVHVTHIADETHFCCGVWRACVSGERWGHCAVAHSTVA